MFGFRRATPGATVAGLIIAAGLMTGAALATPAVAAGAAPAAPAGGLASACVVNASPATFTESGLAPQASSVAFVITVGCDPAYSGQAVEIRTPQLSNACQGQLMWYSATTTLAAGNGDTFDIRLDDDGNATAVVLGGPSCAASRDLMEADLTVAPFTTATTQVQIAAPVTTGQGVFALPASQVEDATTSSVATVFYVEFPSVYAEHEVQISDAELYDSCAGHITWAFPNSTSLEYGKAVTTTLDDNGNAFVVALAGPSCASARTRVEADLTGPPYTTLTTQFTVLSPRVTVKGTRPKEAASYGPAHSRRAAARSRQTGLSPRLFSSRPSSRDSALTATLPRSRSASAATVEALL
jgi:hypothetical protein